MPITQGTFALTMFQADPTVLKNITFDDLKRCSIRPLQGPDEKAVGFAPLTDPYADFDTGWKSHPDIGEYTAFCLRIDTKRIPGAVMKKQFRDALEKEKAIIREQGKQFVSRERKKELKEQIKIRLLAKTEPVPAAYEVVMSRSGTVFLGSNSNTVIDIFQKCFADYFKCDLRELQSQISEEHSLLDLQDSIMQFLTSLVREGIETKDAGIYATGSITVANDNTVLTGVSKSDGDIQELLTAISDGMRVAQTGIRIDTRDTAICTLTITPALRFAGVKLPPTEKPQDDGDTDHGFDAIFLERMFLLEKYTGIILEAFRASIKGP